MTTTVKPMKEVQYNDLLNESRAYLLKSRGAYSFLSDNIRVFVVLREIRNIGNTL